MNFRLGVTLSLAILAAASAGPLTPPAGPVASTYKTLSEVEPRIPLSATTTSGDGNSIYKITQPGSYYLTGNLTGLASKHGIEVSASHVKIDLCGFVVQGVPGSLSGISIDDARPDSIQVRNGVVRSWGGIGIDIQWGLHHELLDVQSLENGNHGVHANQFAMLERCVFALNAGAGLVAGNGSIVQECTARGNSGIGLSIAAGSLTSCTAIGNTTGISVGSGSTVAHCSSNSNSGAGFSSSGATVFDDCTATGNTNAGFNMAGVGGIVRGCSAVQNVSDGIIAATGALIIENTCAFNGSGTGNGAGIHVTGSDTRIEGNNCSGADRGIDVDAAGNIIIRNTCSGNTTDWDIVAGNVYGPIIDRRALVGGAVTGVSAASTMGTTDPHANITY